MPIGTNSKGSSLLFSIKSFEGAIILKFLNCELCFISKAGIMLNNSSGYVPLNSLVSKKRSLYLIHNFLIESIFYELGRKNEIYDFHRVQG